MIRKPTPFTTTWYRRNNVWRIFTIFSRITCGFKCLNIYNNNLLTNKLVSQAQHCDVYLATDTFEQRSPNFFYPRATQVITQQCVCRTSYVMWLFRDMLHSTKSKRFSSIDFFIMYKTYSPAGFGRRSAVWEMTSRAGYGPRAVVWRPLLERMRSRNGKNGKSHMLQGHQQ